MKTLIKIATKHNSPLKHYSLGNTRPRRKSLIWKVAEGMGVMPKPGLSQSKTIDHPPNGDMPLEDSEGKSLSTSKSKPINTYRPGGEGRTMDKKDLKLNAGTGSSILAGRKMKPGQMTQKPAPGGGYRTMKPGQPNLNMSTGGMRKMRGGQPVLGNAEQTLKQRAKTQSLNYSKSSKLQKL